MNTIASLDNSHSSEKDAPVSSDVKLIEARTAILLRNGDSYSTRNEPTMWILEHMFRPLTTRDYNEYQLLLLSGSTKPAWERKRRDLMIRQENYFSAQQPQSTSTTSPMNEGTTPTPPIISSQSLGYQQQQQSIVDKMYIITPRTRILTIAKEHNMVFLIDLSSSLATIETNTGKIMIGTAFTALENILSALVRPFSLNVSDSSPSIVMEHIIRITVIAECSQFGSNINVIPILAEYPTMRVLMQNVLVSINNISLVLKTLNDLINVFKKDLGKFRKKLIMKRSKLSKLGYELDVREDHAQTVEETAESDFNNKNKPNTTTVTDDTTTTTTITDLVSPSNSKFPLPPPSPLPAPSPLVLANGKNNELLKSPVTIKNDRSKPIVPITKKPSAHHHHHNHHSHHHRHLSTSTTAAATTTATTEAAFSGSNRRAVPKEKNTDVWGIGKSGSTLTYMLRTGMFALSLLPQDGQSSIILITDGVVRSNIQDDNVVRQLTSEHVTCNIIQVVQDKSFLPGLNFGFVPDNEILQFLTSATNGVFMFAEHCVPIVQEDIFSNPPNLYHFRFLLKEIYLDNNLKSKKIAVRNSNNSDSNDSGGGISNNKNESISNNTDLTATTTQTVMDDNRSFPWDPIAKPIVEDVGRLKFKEYFLPTECWHFMKARLRQGFVLYSVSLFDEPTTTTATTATTAIPTPTPTTIPKTKKPDEAVTVDQTTANHSFQKKERVIIVFILRWQPNITIEYRIKSLWTSSLRQFLKTISAGQDKLANIPEDPRILDDDNIFSCMRASKAEILIKSNATFSHMLHNWDAFHRRTQMIVVQQGAKSTSTNLSFAPGLAKVDKTKRFLERLVETDAMLKQLVQFNLSEKNLATINGYYSPNTIEWTSRLNYIQKFTSHWSKLDRSELRPFNMCWYDEQDFNLVISTKARYLHLEGTLATDELCAMAMNQIFQNLEGWATFLSDDHQVYVKLLNVGDALDASKMHSSLGLNSSSQQKKHVIPQFCEVRVVRETKKVARIMLMYFNIDIQHRHDIRKELQSLLRTTTAQQTQDTEQNTLAELEVKNLMDFTTKNSVSNGLGLVDENADYGFTIHSIKRPLTNLLMRDRCFQPISELDVTVKNNDNTSQRTKPWFISQALLLTGEFIVKNYLQQFTWHWDTRDIYYNKHSNRNLASLNNLAFEHIANIRLEQGWTVISFAKSFAHFYKELTLPGANNSSGYYSVQYFIWKDAQKKRITTELWLEPLSNYTTYRSHDFIKHRIFEADKLLLSQLITFDIMYSFGKQSERNIVTESLADMMEVEDELRGTTKWMHKSSLFNLSAVLSLGAFLFALYPCPNYKRHFHPEGNDNANNTTLESYQQQNLQLTVTTPVEVNDPGSYITRSRRNVASSTTTVASTTGTSVRSRISKFSPIGSPLATRTPLLWQNEKSSSTTCTCPRPDELFCAENDNISKMRPVLRDIALLHYYVEQSLSAVTNRNMSLNKAPVDEFWTAIIRELTNSKELKASQSALCVAQHFRDLRCFIKIFDPSTFVMILIPRLDTVVKGLNKLDLSCTANSDELSFDKLSIMMFECQRQDTSINFSSVLSAEQIEIKPIDPLSSKEWLESLKSTLRPTLSRGIFSRNLMNCDPLSDRTLRLMQDVSQVYSRSYVKSVFTCLLHGRAVDSEDFEKVLEICDESNIDIDLTGYLNVQTLLKRNSRTNEEELLSANQRFTSVLGHYFEPVIISNTKWSNIYCYRPPFAKAGQKLGLSLLSGEKPSNLADVVVCAQNPLFVRLDCTLRKRVGNKEDEFTEFTFPLRDLPALYEGKTEDGTAYNFEPESIGTTTSSPVDSADGTTATLHLVCMTLPQSTYDPPNALFSHKATCPADNTAHQQASFLDAEKIHKARLPSLSQDKQDALVETEARLSWLFIEEIMHGLLRSGPVTQNVIRYIEAQLKKKNPFVDFPTTMFIPLAFVKNQNESRRMFFEELEKHNDTPYRLVRVGDCFYASHSGTMPIPQDSDLLEEDEEDEDDSLFDGEGLNITTSSNRRKSDQGSDEFCEGLGISILEPETPYNEEEEEPDFTKLGPVRPQLYWLLLIPQAQNVQIYFYSKMQLDVNRSEIIKATKSMVNEVMQRTNKLSLLQHLNETRRCSKYLLNSVEEEKIIDSSAEESSQEEEEEEDFVTNNDGNNLVEILSTSGEETTFAAPKKFIPGQFNCDIVFSKRFPLHWRLQPNTTYTKLMTDTLSPFLVRNNPGMFVISHQKSVVYFFLNEVNPLVHSSTLSDNLNHSVLSASNSKDSYGNITAGESPHAIENDLFSSSNSRVRHSVYSKTSPQGSVCSERQQFSPRASPNLVDGNSGYTVPSPVASTKRRQYEGRELVLDVYGVESNSYIIEGLVDMIDSSITSEITLKEVQQFLIRNPNSKLSLADIEFILPVEKEPLVHQQFCIPSLIENTSQFLKIFRKNILAGSSLYPLHSNYLSATIKRHHDLRYSSYGNSDFNNRLLDEHNNSRTTLSDEWSCLNLSFYYNYLNRTSGAYLPLEQKIGEGVAGISLSVTNEENLAYSRIVSNYSLYANESEPLWFNATNLSECLNSDFEQEDTEGKLKVHVDIWSHCKINCDQIYYCIRKAFRQSICDYIIEATVSSISRYQYAESIENNRFKLIASVLMSSLKKSTEWDSSTVRQITKQIDLAPWYFDGIALQLKSDLIDVHSSLEPIISRAKLSSNLQDFNDEQETELANEEYKIYIPALEALKPTPNITSSWDKHVQSQQQNKTNGTFTRGYFDKKTTVASEIQQQRQFDVPWFNENNYRYLIVSGLPELYNKYVSSSASSLRRSSTETSGGENGHRNRIMFGSLGAVGSIMEEDYPLRTENSRKDDSASLHSRQESMASSISKAFPNYLLKQKSSDVANKDPYLSHQHSFMVFTMDASQLSVYAYNCSDTFTEHIYHAMLKNVVQQETRHKGLNNILNQKLGLFYHSDTMSKIISSGREQIQKGIINTPMPVPATPLVQHNALNHAQNSNGNTRPPMTPSVANNIGRLAHIDSSSSIPVADSGSDRRKTNSSHGGQAEVNFASLKALIKNTYEYNNSSITTTNHNVLLDAPDTINLCTIKNNPAEPIRTTIREADANTILRDIYAESTASNKNGYDKDYLMRHGEPYLEMYLSRSRPLAAHEKAFKVYTKWTKQYYKAGCTDTADEMMKVDELKQILKASRLLHFCRTPLIFSESAVSEANNADSATSGFEKLFNKPIVSKSDDMTAWYEQLSRGFMREYASYLESIGMRLIIYGPSNDQQDEIEAYLSRFNITDDYFVNSPVVYLLRVFEGGSIMCEVRLTGVFVSVTLYTLHQRYGRFQYSPQFQERKEVRRTGFYSFMGECDLFKQRIHVNSFVYDFHLRHIQRSLDDVEMLPSDLNLLSIIKNAASVYDRPAIYSRNRIVNGVYEFSVDETLDELMPWMLASGTELGFKTLKSNNHPIALFVSSDDLSFKLGDSTNETGGPFRYTLIVCPAEKTTYARPKDTFNVHKQGSFDFMESYPTENIIGRTPGTMVTEDMYIQNMNLNYFLLAIYRGMDRCSSSDRCQTAWSEIMNEKSKRRSNFLDEKLTPEPFTMNDILEFAKIRMDSMVTMATHLFRRESDWNKLYEIIRPNVSKETPESLVALCSKFNPVNLGEVDPSFNKFLQLEGVNWDDALDHLKLFYLMTSGEVQVQDTRHVLLFIPNVSTHTFFHFEYITRKKCTVSVNTKEDRRDDLALQQEEKSYITQLATSLSYYIWKKSHY